MASQVASRINSWFQSEGSDHEAGKNINGVVYRSILVNVAVTPSNDGSLVVNATSAPGANSAYQMVGFDAFGESRNERRYHSFNFFARGNGMSSSTPTFSNRRWLAVVDGTTKEILYNQVLPDSFSALSESRVSEIREAVNSAELPAPGEDFDSWAMARIPNAQLRGENEDPDGDDIVNLLEYAYGTDPVIADSGKGPRIVTEDGQQFLQYQRDLEAQVTPLVILGGDSPDSAETVESTGIEEVEASSDGIEFVKVSLPQTLGGRMFIRLSTSRQ